jgi:hypothetical protein
VRTVAQGIDAVVVRTPFDDFTVGSNAVVRAPWARGSSWRGGPRVNSALGSIWATPESCGPRASSYGCSTAMASDSTEEKTHEDTPFFKDTQRGVETCMLACGYPSLAIPSDTEN